MQNYPFHGRSNFLQTNFDLFGHFFNFSIALLPKLYLPHYRLRLSQPFILEKDHDEIYREAQKPRVPLIGPFLTLTTKPLIGCDNLLSVKVMANQSNKYWRNISAIQQYRYKSSELPDWCLYDVPFLVWVVYITFFEIGATK